MSRATDIFYGLVGYSFGYWWRWWRDRKIARELERKIAALRQDIRR